MFFYIVKLSLIILLGFFLLSCDHKARILSVNNKSSVYQSHTQPYVIYVDFSKPSTEKRFTVMQGTNTIYSTWVTHGSGSGTGEYATRFSNEPNSHASSLGRYKVLGIYRSYHHGLVFKLQGLDYTNSNAYSREILIHSALYIGDGKIGTSWGCFAVTPNAMYVLLKIIPKGTALVAFIH